MKALLSVCAAAMMIGAAVSSSVLAETNHTKKSAPVKTAKEPEILFWIGCSDGDGYTTDVRGSNITLAQAQAIQKPGLSPEDKLVVRRVYPIPLDVYYIPRLAKSSKKMGKRNTVLVA